MPAKYIQAYYEHSLITDVKSFIRLYLDLSYSKEALALTIITEEALDQGTML